MKKTLLVLAVALGALLILCPNDVTAQELSLSDESLDIAKSDADELTTVIVESTSLSDFHRSEIKSDDFAEALSAQTPAVSLIRRSGVNNDILLRGQKKDNINITVDGGKIYGACPNRMDPPTSHIITRNIDKVRVVRGPYDVENAGSLSGVVSVETIIPETQLHGLIQGGVGSFERESGNILLTGGVDQARALLSMSTENSGQYKDGDGNTFAEQIDQAIAKGSAAPGNAYLPSQRARDAYEKNALMGKVFVEPFNKQQLELSYTLNRSDEVLYPNTPMDALYDDSDLYNFKYRMKDLGLLSDVLEFKYYYSTVRHPMWNGWRVASGSSFPMNAGEPNVFVNSLRAKVQGGTLKSSTQIFEDTSLSLGLDASLRNWDGKYIRNDTILGPSINDIDTRNIGTFLKLDSSFAEGDAGKAEFGIRFDDSEVRPGGSRFEERGYESVGTYLLSSYELTASNVLIAGIGSATRVPDARELYFERQDQLVGTPTLSQTRNFGVDLGLENQYENFSLDVRGFASWLSNYISFNSSREENKFENIDARIVGIEMQGQAQITRSLALFFGIAYQRGTRANPLSGQSRTELADIPPLRGNTALRWHYHESGSVKFESLFSDTWSRFDEENGEQSISSWQAVNLKVDQRLDQFLRRSGGVPGITGDVSSELRLVLGVDNLFDETYAVSNTYRDLTLISFDPEANVTLLNEPGRYFYVHLAYQF